MMRRGARRPRAAARRRAASRPAPPEAADAALHELLARDWEWRLRESPILATLVGDPRYDDRWPDVSLEAHVRRGDDLRRHLMEARALKRRALSPAGRLNLDLLLHALDLEVESLRFPEELLPVNQMNGVQQDVADLLGLAPRHRAQDLDNMVARLRTVGGLVDQTIDLLRAGASRGITPPRVVMTPVPAQVEAQIAADPAAAPVAAAVLSDLPADLDPAVARRFRAEVLRATTDVVIPAWRRLRACLVDEYLPRTRASLALSALPDGEAWYAHRVRRITARDLSPRAIHDLGLEEVARIRGSMVDTMRAAGHAGDLPAFLHVLRTDPRFFLPSRERILAAYRDICKRIDPALPRLFRTLPRLPYGVQPVPGYSEKEQVTAYYHPGSHEAGRPGWFFANTYAPESRPTWEMEALAAHESVPGHHLQMALAQEIEDLPPFRRHGHETAFVEGWGLYAESLGEDLGLYRDPYARFGRLTYEMWRAVRLVVDTGVHAFGWTRERAISYFEERAGKAGHDIAVEVDRYIAWPGQALAYKLGELAIRALRDAARRGLGERFDIRDFHDAVLLAGPLPLPILETRVREWIASRRRRPAAPRRGRA